MRRAFESGSTTVSSGSPIATDLIDFRNWAGGELYFDNASVNGDLAFISYHTNASDAASHVAYSSGKVKVYIASPSGSVRYGFPDTAFDMSFFKFGFLENGGTSACDQDDEITIYYNLKA
jgi:hypothetical protein